MTPCPVSSSHDVREHSNEDRCCSASIGKSMIGEGLRERMLNHQEQVVDTRAR